MAQKDLIPFKASHPGSLVKDELDYRGVKQKDFAHDIDMQPSMLNEIIKGKRAITAQIALILEKALGINADYWLRHQSQYDLDVERIKEKNIKKAQLVEHWQIIKKLVPVKPYRKLNVFKNDLENDIQIAKQIYNVNTIDELANNIATFKTNVGAYYRKSNKLQVDEINLLGWSKLATWCCSKIQVADYRSNNLAKLKEEVKEILYKNTNIKVELQNCFTKYGIKLIFQPKFDKTPIDGFSFLSNNKPAIALTLRHNRIDNLAFTLMHEIAHVDLHLFSGQQKEYINFDTKLGKRTDIEKEADLYAQKYLIPEEQWNNFIENYSTNGDKGIEQFSEKYKIHPYIVFGRFSHESDFLGRKTKISKEIN